MQLEFSRQIFEKSSNIKFHENLSGGSRVVPLEQMDWRTGERNKANNRFLKFCERAQNTWYNVLNTEGHVLLVL